MLERKMLSKLQSWKEAGANKVFVLLGARQTGKDYKLHVALNNLLGTAEYGIGRAYVLSEHNVSRGERKGKPVYYLPLYMAMCLAAERGERKLAATTLEAVGFEDLL